MQESKVHSSDDDVLVVKAPTEIVPATGHYGFPLINNQVLWSQANKQDKNRGTQIAVTLSNNTEEVDDD